MTVNLTHPLVTANVKDFPYNAKGDGSTDDTAAIQAAITAASGSGTIHFPVGTYKITSNLVFAAGTTLRFDHGGTLKPSSGAVTITLSAVEAGVSQQIFDISASGKVTFAYPASIPQEKLSVKWWGALGDNSHDDSAAIQAAIDAALNILVTTNNPPALGAVWSNTAVFLPHGVYLVSSAGTNIACLEMPDATKFVGENSVLNCVSPNQHILRSGNYFNHIEGITFLHGKSAIIMNGPSHHYGGNLGTVTAGGPNTIQKCQFFYNAGPSIFLDTTIEGRSSAAAMFVRDSYFQTSCAWHAGFDGCQISDIYAAPAQSTFDDPAAILVYDDDGYILPFMVSYDNLILQNCVMAPQTSSQSVLSTHGAWMGGAGVFVARNTRFGGEGGLPLVRLKVNNFHYYGQNLADITDTGSYNAMVTIESCVVSSCAGLFWMEIHDYFPAKIDVRMLHQGIPSGLPYGNVLMDSNGIWLDSTTLVKSDYLYRQRSTIAINFDNFVDASPDFRFITSNNVLQAFGEDVTAQLKRYYVNQPLGSAPSIGVSQNYWPAGITDLSGMVGVNGVNVTFSGTDTTTGYSITGLVATANTGVYVAASGSTPALSTSMSSGEYTLSMAVKSSYNGQVSLSFGDPTDPFNGAKYFIFDTLDFSDGYQWQRIETTFFYDGYVNRSIAVEFFGIPSGQVVYMGLFALQKGRDVKDWTYPGNPTAQDDVLATYYATAIPVSGTYKQGDTVINTTPTLGSPVGWVCTVGGTPGTFQPMANAGGSPAGAAGGDLSGTYPNPLVAAISGSSPINITPATLQWTKGTSTPTLTQATPTTDVAPQTITISPQAPFASATSSNRIGGNLEISLAAPTNSGTATPWVRIKQHGTTYIGLSPYSVTDGTAFGGLYFMTNADAPGSANYALIGSASDTYMNAPSGAIHLRFANAELGTLNSGTFQFTAPIFQSLATTYNIIRGPANYLDSDIIHLRDSTGTEWSSLSVGSSIQLTAAVAVTSFFINQSATTSATGAALTIRAQGATGAAHNGGALNLSSGSSGSATVGTVNIQAGGTTVVSADTAAVSIANTVNFNSQPSTYNQLKAPDNYLDTSNATHFRTFAGVDNGKVDGSGVWASNGLTTQILMGQWGVSSAFAGLFVGANASAQSGTNYTLVCDGTSTFVNAPSGTGALSLLLGNSSGVVISPGLVTTNLQILEWTAAVSAPVLAQANESSATKGQDLTIQPQQSTHATDFGGGNLLIALQTPGGAGVEAGLQVTRGGTFAAQIGPYPGLGATYSALWLVPNVSPTASTITMLANGGASGTVQITSPGSVGGGVYLQTNAGNTNVLQASPNGTAASSPFAFFPNGTISFLQSLSAPTITQATQTSDVATNPLTITPQAPFASATSTNRTGGNLVVALAAPTNGGTAAPLFIVKQNTTRYAALGPVAAADGTAYGALYLGDAPIGAPAIGNYAVISNGTDTYLNAPTGVVNLTVTDIIYVTMSTTVLTLAVPAIAFSSALTAPNITQGVTSSASGQPFTIQAQNATGATHNGGDITLASGTSGSALPGNVFLKVGSTALVELAGSTILFNGHTTFSSTASTYNQLKAPDNYFDNTTTHFRDTTPTEYFTITPGTTTTLQFAAAATTSTFNQAGTSSASGATLTIQAQGATGATHNGGELLLASGTSGSASAGIVQIQVGSQVNTQFVLLSGNSAFGVTNATAIGSTNYNILSDGTSFTVVNGIGELLFRVGGASTPGFGYDGNTVQIGSETFAGGGGSGVLGMHNATTNPTTNPANGGVLYASGGALFWRSSNGVVTTVAPA